MENFREYYFLNVIVSINSFREFNVTVNTTLKYYHNQLLSKKLYLMGGAMKFLWKKLLSHEIFSSMVLWVTKFYLKNL